MANNDRVSDLYHRRIHSSAAQNACRDRVHWLCRHVVGPRVLDVGCSQGVTALILGREGRDVIGLDIEQEVLEEAREALRAESQPVQKRVSFRLGDALSAEFEPESFDTIVAGEVLEHLAAPERLLERIRDWLRPGGRCLISVPHGFDPFQDHKQTFYLMRIVKLLGPCFHIERIEPVHAKYLCAVATRPEPGEAPRTPSPETLQRWLEDCEAGLEAVQRQACDERDVLQADRSRLSERGAAYRKRIENLEKAHQEARAAQEQAHAELEKLRQELQGVREERKRAAMREVELTRDSGRLTAQTEMMSDEVKELKTLQQEMRREANDAHSAMIEAKAQCARLQSELSAAVDKYNEAVQQANRVEQEHTATARLLESSQAELQTGRRRLTAEQEKAHEHAAKLAELCHQLQDAREEWKRVSMREVELTRECGRLTAQTEMLSDEVKAMKQLQQDTRREANDAHSAMVEAGAQCAQLQRDLWATRDKCNEALQQATRFEQEHNATARLLESSQAELETARRRLTTEQEKAEQHTAQLAEVRRTQASVERKAKEVERARDGLAKEHERLTQNHHQATRLLAEERRDRQRAEARAERLNEHNEYHKAELELRRNEVRYKIGDAFVRAARPSLDTLALPVRFVRLFFVGLQRVLQRRRESQQRRHTPQTVSEQVLTAKPVTGAPPPASSPAQTPADQSRPAVNGATRGTQPTGVESPPIGPQTTLDAIPVLAAPFSRTPAELRRTDLRVAAVTDEFSWRAWQYEADLYTFTPKTWREALEAYKPELLLVESAWSGLNDSWYFQLRDLGKRAEVIKYYAIPDIIAWCRSHGVPTVFYNKEDPPNFDVFIDAAKQFDFVFTSDENCIENYRKHIGHDRILALPFAAQPRIHNPVLAGSRVGSVCFAGTWYNHRHFGRHDDANSVLRPALDFDLHIFDRMANSGNENYRWPDEFLTAVRGALPYSQMLAAYKRYKVFLNVNSVKNSPTMFSRRVFELLACGTPVISSVSVGIENLLGSDIVLMSDNERDTREMLGRLLGDDEYRERLSLRGQRKVFSEHTYTRRLHAVLDAVGIGRPEAGRPRVTMLAAATNAHELAAAVASYRCQEHANKRLVVCADRAAAASAPKVVGDARDVQVIVRDSEGWGRVMREAVLSISDGHVAALHPAHDYGPHYLTDYANAALYATESAIGKASFYQSDGAAEPKIAGRGKEYRVVSAVEPWTLCVTRAAAAAAAAKLSAAQSPHEWWNRAMRGLGRIYSADRFNYAKVHSPPPASDNCSGISRSRLQAAHV